MSAQSVQSPHKSSSSPSADPLPRRIAAGGSCPPPLAPLPPSVRREVDDVVGHAYRRAHLNMKSGYDALLAEHTFSSDEEGEGEEGEGAPAMQRKPTRGRAVGGDTRAAEPFLFRFVVAPLERLFFSAAEAASSQEEKGDTTAVRRRDATPSPTSSSTAAAFSSATSASPAAAAADKGEAEKDVQEVIPIPPKKVRIEAFLAKCKADRRLKKNNANNGGQQGEGERGGGRDCDDEEDDANEEGAIAALSDAVCGSLLGTVVAGDCPRRRGVGGSSSSAGNKRCATPEEEEGAPSSSSSPPTAKGGAAPAGADDDDGPADHHHRCCEFEALKASVEAYTATRGGGRGTRRGVGVGRSAGGGRSSFNACARFTKSFGALSVATSGVVVLAMFIMMLMGY